MAASNSTPRRVLITGANRGLGLAVAQVLAGRGWHVLAAARTGEEAQATAAALAQIGGSSEPVTLDLDSPADLERLATAPPQVDVLVNNAGWFAAWDGLPNASAADILRSLAINAVGPFQLIQAVSPGMRARGWGRVVNVSSGMGGLTEMGAGAPAYRISKAALNAVTRVCAEELAGTGVLVNSVCPGWVQTRMGGTQAPRSLDQGAASILWAVDVPDGGPSGGFYRDGEPLAW